MKKALRRRLVDTPDSIGGKARARRSEQFLATFPNLAEMDVLDLGGTFSSWERMPVRPRSVTTLNPELMGEFDADWFIAHRGDACEPPPEIEMATFDLVYSNSVIEHVGDEVRRRQFADVVHRVAGRHWIQTPNRAFPIEPHVLFPLHQFLPALPQALVYRYWPLCHTNGKTMDAARALADEIELLTRKEFADLFPKSELINEEFVHGLPPKSLIAVLA